MKAKTTKRQTITLSMKQSGAKVLQDAFVFSKTISKAVAVAKHLDSEDAIAYATSLQRCLRRVRKALENVS